MVLQEWELVRRADPRNDEPSRCWLQPQPAWTGEIGRPAETALAITDMHFHIRGVYPFRRNGQELMYLIGGVTGTIACEHCAILVG